MLLNMKSKFKYNLNLQKSEKKMITGIVGVVDTITSTIINIKKLEATLKRLNFNVYLNCSSWTRICFVIILMTLFQLTNGKHYYQNSNYHGSNSGSSISTSSGSHLSHSHSHLNSNSNRNTHNINNNNNHNNNNNNNGNVPLINGFVSPLSASSSISSDSSISSINDNNYNNNLPSISSQQGFNNDGSGGNHQNYHQQRFAMEPQDQTAVVGSRVTLPCRVINKQGLLQWTKDDFGLGTHRNLSGFERYSMIGSDEEGDYSLDIYPIMLDDDARYQCQVSGTHNNPAIRSNFATLTILVPPENPEIVQGSKILTTEDRKTEIECISVGGKPPAEITWIDGHGNVVKDNVEYSVQQLPDMRRFTAKSVLHLIPKQEHHNTNFTCQAQNTADRTYRSVKIHIEVKYAPKVKVSIISGALAGGRLPELAQVRLECKADANPSDLKYRWFINDEPIIGGHKTEMVIKNVTRKFHDAIVKCEVQNSVGKSEDSETLDVTYGPQFKQRPQSVEADIGTTVSLNCEVDGNPQPDIVWIQHPIDRVVGVNSNLTFIVTNETAGRYYCKANVPGYSDIQSDASIYVKGSPIVTSNRFQYGLIGDTARIECYAISVPKARHVSWTFNGHEINSESGGSSDYSILSDTVPGGVRSTLIIRDSESYHYGKYNCTVVNDYGNDVAEIQLQAQKSVPLLMTIVGGISSVGILMILTIIVLIYFKCKKNKELPQADVISEHQINKLGVGHNHLNHHHHQNHINMSGMGLGMGMSMKEPGDRTSNYSDLKVDISSGYVPYADYTTHYSPPPQYLTTIQQQQQQQQQHQQQQTITNSTSNTLSNGKINNGVDTLDGTIMNGIGIVTTVKGSTLNINNGSNSNTNSLQHNHHNHHHHQNHYHQQSNGGGGGGNITTNLVPMAFMNGGSLTGSIIGSRAGNVVDILRQDNGLPSLQSTCTTVTTSLGGSGCGSSLVSSSPNGSTSNSINTHIQHQQQQQHNHHHQHQYSSSGSGNGSSSGIGSGSGLNVIDPRYSAIYGNPYLKNSNSSLLPPPTAV